ncbi:hypothetical protein C8A01DRAFT_14593, partial [Parachaetomium inaequale]
VRRKPRCGAVRRRQEKGRLLQPQLWACIWAAGYLLEGTRDELVSRAANDRRIRPSAIARTAGCRVKREGQQPATAVSGCPQTAEAHHHRSICWQAEKDGMSQTSISSTVLGGRNMIRRLSLRDQHQRPQLKALAASVSS